MIPGGGIKQPQPLTRSELFGDSGVTSWYRVCDDTCHGVEGYVINTESPNKILDVTNMLLMGFWRKDGLKEPMTIANLSYVANLFKCRHSSPHNW